jgi:hypothetical protein
MSAVPFWWEYLNHGGMLIGPAQLEEHYLGRLPDLPPYVEEKLRRAVVRLEEGDSNVSGLLDTVLEDVLGLENGPLAIIPQRLRPGLRREPLLKTTTEIRLLAEEQRVSRFGVVALLYHLYCGLSLVRPFIDPLR